MNHYITEWGRKAAALYATDYARRYREHDDQLDGVDVYLTFCSWVSELCRRFDAPIDVLDLGCGTGRYFSALTNVNHLVGLDASKPMLAEAVHPHDAGRITVGSVELVEGDALTHEFAPASFNLIYSVGVLAEHTPFDARIVENAARWLRPGGRFAFTTVHPESTSIPRTLARAVGTAVAPISPWPIRPWLRRRLTANGQYADEMLIAERLNGLFLIESLSRLQSEAHLHCLCVARKTERHAISAKRRD